MSVLQTFTPEFLQAQPQSAVFYLILSKFMASHVFSRDCKYVRLLTRGPESL